jgi:8-oxo-dGTP pyrophosphatase MutT (NUDIX family)/membrane-associated phospholipid phosphatase
MPKAFIFSLAFSVIAQGALHFPAMGAVPISGNAGCIIQVQNKMIFVKDLWSGRYSLPAGTAERGETPAQTAQRETLEETGISVKVGALLAQAPNGFSIFECSPNDGLVPVLNHFRIPHPKGAFNEISEVILSNPVDIPIGKWRFQSQINLINDTFQKLDPFQSARTIPARLNPDSIVSAELQWISDIQRSRASWITSFIRFISFLGGKAILIVLLLFLWFVVDRCKGMEACFLLGVTVLAHQITKQAFGSYRPFHYMPNLQFDNATGFGFPSSRTAELWVIWVFIASQFRFPGRWGVAIGMILWGGVAQVYVGVQFVHDVLGGWLLGALILLGYEFYRKRGRRPGIGLFIGLKDWAIISLIFGVVALVVEFNPETVAVVSLVAGLLIGLAARHAGISKKHSVSRFGKFEGHAQFLIAILGLFLIEKAAKFCFPTDAAFFPCFLNTVTKYMLMGIWIGSQPVRPKKVRT